MKKLFLLLTTISILFISCKSNSQDQQVSTANTVEINSKKNVVNDVSVADFTKAIELPNATLVDVRTLKEYNQGHIEGAIHIDWYKRSFKNNVLHISKEKPILIYCRSGNRTSKTSGVLKSLGFKEIYNLQSGINKWTTSKASLTFEDSQKNKLFQELIASSTKKVQTEIASSGKVYNVKALNFDKVIKLENVTIVDIRTPQEFNSGHIKGAVNIDWYQRSFKEKIQSFAKDKPIAIYCRSGNRTSKAASVLHSMGFKEIINLAYGINDWNKNRLPLEK